MVQVQLRMPEETVKEIDKLVEVGNFKNRSDAVKGIVMIYMESQKTRKFYQMLVERSEEAKKHPEKLIPLDDL